MTTPRQSSALNPLGPDFDRFLYAQVGDDRDEGPLSVISALARVGVDPWEEAASLARLPPDVAANTFSQLLARLPAGSGRPENPVPVATRLVVLLPRGERLPSPPFHAATASGIANGPNFRLMAVVGVLCFLFYMATQLVMHYRAATAPLATPAPDVTGTLSPQPESSPP